MKSMNAMTIVADLAFASIMFAFKNKYLTLMFAALCFATPSQAKDGEWAEGAPFTTSWEDAIKEVRATGKMLFIYNGWESETT